MSIIINKNHIDEVIAQEVPKSVFCSIPRTASNGMTVYLLDGYLLEGFESVRECRDFYYADRFITTSHRKYNHFISGYEDVYNGLKFATIRNTYDRLVSLCEHLRANSIFDVNFKIDYDNKVDLFKKFLCLIKEVREKNMIDEWGLNNALPQLLYIQNDGINDIREYSRRNIFTVSNVNIGVDYLLQYETLESDYAELCGILKIPNKFGAHFATKSKRDATIKYYDKENKRNVDDLYGFEIDYFEFNLEG